MNVCNFCEKGRFVDPASFVVVSYFCFSLDGLKDVKCLENTIPGQLCADDLQAKILGPANSGG